MFSLFNEKARKRVRVLSEQIKSAPVKKEGSKRLLFHCASHGEFLQIKPLLSLIKEAFPLSKIALSFFSPSGYEIGSKWKLVDESYYLPIDTKSNVRRFIDLIDPDEVFLVKYEIWPNLIDELHDRGIPVSLLSARFYKGQLFFRWYGKLLRDALQKLDTIYVQDEQSERRLSTIDVKSIYAGDTRADKSFQLSQERKRELHFISEFKNGKKMLILGSIWPEDWAIFTPVLTAISRQFKIVIAPHEFEPVFLAKIEHDACDSFARYSTHKQRPLSAVDILLLDTIGYLADAYSFADLAFIGGAFKQGLHNVFEPAGHGIPIITGPNLTGFNEARELLERNALVTVRSSDELLKVIEAWSDVDARQHAGNASAAYIKESAGATQTIFAHLKAKWET